MSTDKRNLERDKRNADDFEGITNRLTEALKKIEGSPRLKATQKVLCELASCSRGTVNNRVWPVEWLDRIKRERKSPKMPLEPESSEIEQEVNLVERLEKQLNDSRDEIVVWKNKHDDISDSYQAQLNLTRVQINKVAGLEAENARLRKLARASKVSNLR